MSHSIPPDEIERGHDHGEKEPVTNHANNNASPPFTHASSSRPRIRTAHIGYFPSLSSAKIKPFITGAGDSQRSREKARHRLTRSLLRSEQDRQYIPYFSIPCLVV